jgi:diguanylate cyclase (GGDEF)-like protein
MNLERVLRFIARAIGKLSRGQVFAVALLGVAIVGIPDYLIASEISLSLLYLCPVGIATWYAGGKAGMVIALISTLSVIAGDFGDGDYFRRPGIAVWNAVLHLGFMLVIAFLLDRLRTHLATEQELARSDALTGVLNARAFVEQLQLRLDLAAREGTPITLAYIDLDDFKQVNDRGGHGEGDRVLRLVADTIGESIRSTDSLARLGGDEFGLLIGGADRAAAEVVISNLRNALRKVFAHERSPVTCSIGCATFVAPLPGADDAIRAADDLMYEVKNRGKNAVAFWVLGDQTGGIAQSRTATDAPLPARRRASTGRSL